MINNLSCYMFIISLIPFLSGCTRIEQKSISVKEKNLIAKQSQLDQSVLTVPNIPSRSELIEQKKQLTQLIPHDKYYNWDHIVQPMVNRMMNFSSINSNGTILLIDKINNFTNGLLNINEATEVLRNKLINNTKFTLVSKKKLVLAKQQLGLSLQDKLGSCSKAIGIARKVGAQYVLYSSIIGNINTPTLQMQLIKVKTGEIIWSDKVNIQNEALSRNCYKDK